MKKSFSVVFVFCLLLLLTSCGTRGDSLDSLCSLIGSKIETYKFYNTSETDVGEVINKDVDENYYDSQYNYNFYNGENSDVGTLKDISIRPSNICFYVKDGIICKIEINCGFDNNQNSKENSIYKWLKDKENNNQATIGEVREESFITYEKSCDAKVSINNKSYKINVKTMSFSKDDSPKTPVITIE